MSFSNPRVVALAAAAALISHTATARDGQGRAGSDIQQIAPYAHDPSDVIHEMPPLQPARKGGIAMKPAPKPAEVAPVAPPVAVAPAPIAAAPAPVSAPVAPVSAPPVAAVEPAREPAPIAAAQPETQPQPAAQAPVAAAQEPAHMALVAPKPQPEPAPVAAAEPPVVVQEKPTVVEPPAAAEARSETKDEAKAEAPVTVEAKIEAPAKTETAQGAPAALVAQPSVEAQPAEPAPAAETRRVDTALQGEPKQSASEPGARIDAGARIAALLAQGVKGPAEVRIADRATLWLPAGRVYLTGETAEKLAKEASFEWRAGVQGLVAPAGDAARWLAPVELLDDGHINAVDPAALDGDKMLAAFRAGLPDVNKARAAGGQPPVELTGWLNPPRLDEKHRLSACVNVAPKAADAQGFFNCEAWALGRDGAIKVSLAEVGEEAQRLKDETQTLVDTIVFDHGKAYEDVAPADKVAPYSVSDLLVSDVTAKAAATRNGAEENVSPRGLALALLLFAKFWKVLLFAAAAVISAVAWFRRRHAVAGERTATAKAAPIAAPKADSPKADAPKAAAASLFARLLPTLHAKFARGAAPAASASKAEAPKAEAPVESVADRRKNRTPEKKSGGLVARLMGKGKEEPAEEPAEALKTLASRMRGATEKSASAAAATKLPGAAPDEKPQAPVVAKGAEPATAKDSAVASAAPESFGLVEPGDTEATSAAISAGRALREARG